jgi:hypothetical protein
MLSSLTDKLIAFSLNCTSSSGKPCSESPNYASNYFDLESQSDREQSVISVDGYTTYATPVNQSICIDAAEIQSFCTP